LKMDPSKQPNNVNAPHPKQESEKQSVELGPLEPLEIEEVSFLTPNCANSITTPSTCQTSDSNEDRFESISVLSMNDSSSTVSSFQAIRWYALDVLNQCDHETSLGRRKSTSDLISTPDAMVLRSKAQTTQMLLPQRNSFVDLQTLKGRQPTLTGKKQAFQSSLTVSPTPTALKKRPSMPPRAYSNYSINTEPALSDRVSAYERRTSIDRRKQLNSSLGSLLDPDDALALSHPTQNAQFRVARAPKRSSRHRHFISNEAIGSQTTIEKLIGETRTAVDSIGKTAKPSSDSSCDGNSGFWSLYEPIIARSPRSSQRKSSTHMAKAPPIIPMQKQESDLKQKLAEKDVMIQMLAQQLEDARALQEKEKMIQMLSQELQELKTGNLSTRKSKTSDVKVKRKSKSVNTIKRAKSLSDLGLDEVEGSTTSGKPSRKPRSSKVIKDAVAKKKKAKSLRSKSPHRYFMEENSLADSERKERKPKISRRERSKSMRIRKSKDEKRVPVKRSETSAKAK